VDSHLLEWIDFIGPECGKRVFFKVDLCGIRCTTIEAMGWRAAPNGKKKGPGCNNTITEP
jgi:hypothetical protein